MAAILADWLFYRQVRGPDNPLDPGLDRQGARHLQRRIGAGIDEGIAVELERVAVVRLRCNRPQDRRGVPVEQHVGAVGLDRGEAERVGIVERRVHDAGVGDPEPDPGAIGDEGHQVRGQELRGQCIGQRRVQIDEKQVTYNFGDWHGVHQDTGYLATLPLNVRQHGFHTSAVKRLLGVAFAVGSQPTDFHKQEVFTGSSTLKVYANLDV
ncbi:MAG: hypothetical protein B7Z55_19760, partial [Planctomycetales bacterium 12-60-4]